MAEYNSAVQELASLSYTTIDQHTELAEARMNRDALDLDKISTKLTSCLSFAEDPSMRNVIHGVLANDNINIHEFLIVGEKIIENWTACLHIFAYTERYSHTTR